MNEHKPDWGWISGGAIMLLLGGISLWKAWLAFAITCRFIPEAHRG